MTTPRLFIIRHGETAWSLSGRHTGLTDIPLTPNGEKRILATGSALIGPDRLIVPHKLSKIYVSPRKRARRTLELLGIETEGIEVEVTERVREWEYGDYEGITSAEIRERRKREGKGEWDIWMEGCPGGESPREITSRLDDLIAEIREQYHSKVVGKPKGSKGVRGDVLIVAHGHVLRALAGRWVGRELGENPGLILEAGGVGTLSYEHGRIEEPAILLGGAFMSDFVENCKGGC